MSDNNYLKLIAPLVIFSFITVFFLFYLKKLNSYLIEHYFKTSSFALIAHNNYEPLKFFFFAIFLVVLGGFLAYYYIKSIIKNNLGFQEAIVALLGILITIVLICLIIHNINIPIFQAILSVFFISGIAIAVFSGSN